jgi:hypothetical protein
VRVLPSAAGAGVEGEMNNQIRDGGLPDVLSLPEGYLSGMWLVNPRDVNLDDLISAEPGRIVRVRNQDAVRYIPSPQDQFERVAGMISDAA